MLIIDGKTPAIQLYNSSRIPEAGDHSLPIQDKADLEKCLKVWNVPKATLQFRTVWGNGRGPENRNS